MDQAVISSSSAIANAHPLIDLDWTVAIQFALFGILFLVARALLFKPYLALRERRRENIEGAREKADQMTATADAKLADYEKKLAGARNLAAEEGRKIRGEAIAHEKDVTDKARAQAQAAIDQASAKMRQETEAARLALLPQANAMAKQIASKLLGREVA